MTESDLNWASTVIGDIRADATYNRRRAARGPSVAGPCLAAADLLDHAAAAADKRLHELRAGGSWLDGGNCNEPGLFDIAAALRAHWTGSSDPLPNEERDRLLAGVRLRLASWKPSATFTAAYDDAVRALLLAVLADFDREMR